ADRAGELCADIERDLLSADGVDADLPAEEQLIAVIAELKDATVFQEEGPLFGEKDLERSDVELDWIDVRIGKISIEGQVGYETAAEAVLDIEPAGVQGVSAGLRIGADAAQDVRLNDQQAAATDLAQIAQFAAFGNAFQAIDSQVGLP